MKALQTEPIELRIVLIPVERSRCPKPNTLGLIYFTLVLMDRCFDYDMARQGFETVDWKDFVHKSNCSYITK